ncbi:transglutaminase domain-containing protein [Calidifontibacillus erzurumensis]|uniref:transglutaminase domain-containing protein n=1 Tax=Calidifontibacillus erzurumensis TaxID=2741433 RepID=UPI001E3A868F|nr:transglutaminase domain-containing protein [Calidifontibacillus erzurumensis]
MSNLFRTFLFLILLWVMAYLFQYWLFQVKKIFAFYVVTIIFLAILDTFTRYDADSAIVRTMAIGLFMLGLLQMSRLKEREAVNVRAYWLLIFSAMVAIAVGIGLHAPKAEPQWPDPVPFIKSAAKEAVLGNSVRKIGYGIDDSRLGGTLVMDRTTVFTAQVNEEHYWRVESKDFYTGKGWEVSENIPPTFINKDDIYLGILENVDKEKNLTANVLFENAGFHPHIVYPVDPVSIKTAPYIELAIDRMTGKFFAAENGAVVQLGSYKVIYDLPRFSIEALKLANSGDHPYIKKLYTQLPPLLPDRVKELAANITKDKATRYEKVKAVENYFAQNGFIYETRNIAIPSEDEDYVDQFLFETKKGYCDNFSSAMIVLLRSIDIPSRWVKGYTQGDLVKTLDNGKKLYKVTNANAHSWVEVYFPGIGWVPFEPTKGFRNPVTFTESTIPQMPQAGQNEELLNNQNDGKEKKENEQTKDIYQMNSGILKNFKQLMKNLGILIGLAILLVVLAFKGRKKWYPYWYKISTRLNKNTVSPNHMFERLFLLLESKGLKVERGETLREFASRVDAYFGTSEMRQITDVYEKYLYAGSIRKIEDWEKVRKLLENLTKKILS